MSSPLAKYGSDIPGAEPYWYQGFPSPYYNDAHVAFRARVRKFVEEEVKPHIDEWIEAGGYPPELHQRFHQLGLGSIIYDSKYGGSKDTTPNWDYFYELILLDEMGRTAGGHVLGQSAINSMAIPPIAMYGSDKMKQEVIRPVVEGRKFACLAISEPYAGSDVTGIRATAVRKGDKFVVNGIKKWITGGATALQGANYERPVADTSTETNMWFTTCVRTGGEGPLGISLLLIPRNLPGVRVRKMKTQFDSSHSTTMVFFEDVEVPAENLIGPENGGLMVIFQNFNHERWVISVGACRVARLLYEMSFEYALKRETFGKKLMSHQIIRYKLAEMQRLVEALHDTNERIAYMMSKGVSDTKLGSVCALNKVNASKTLEYCAREAAQIFGGNSIVREGQGKLVERLYREVRAMAIPGGSEEILEDFAIRQAVKVVQHKRSKL